MATSPVPNQLTRVPPPAGKSKAEGLPWFLHSRHPFDPPEIVTVVEVVGSKPLHWGYHRDAPETRPRCVVASVPDKKHKRGRFDELAPTLLDAMTSHGQTFVSKLRDGDKDRKEAAKSCLQRVVAAAKALPAASSPFRRPIDTTLNKLGIAVPYDKKTEVGWRELSVSDAELQAYLEKLLETKARGESPNFTELDRLITFANIANDECDPGQALKLGLDLFTVVELDSDTANLLTPTYKLLNRDKFAEVIEAHTAGDRRRSGETSILVD